MSSAVTQFDPALSRFQLALIVKIKRLDHALELG
jgi:hypothetical protein